MVALMSLVKEVTVTLGTVFDPDEPPDDDVVVPLPHAATASAAPHVSNTAPPLRW